MQDLIIKAENQLVEEAIKNFLLAYNDKVCEYLNLYISERGQRADATITEEDVGIVIRQVAIDKGWVLGSNDGSTVELMKYNDVEHNKKYILFNNDKLYLYLKRAPDFTDVKVGHFKSLNDAVLNINGQDVQLAVAQTEEKVRALSKAEARAEKRAAKLKKLKKP
jgi:hypothetical protein